MKQKFKIFQKYLNHLRLLLKKLKVKNQFKKIVNFQKIYHKKKMNKQINL